MGPTARSKMACDQNGPMLVQVRQRGVGIEPAAAHDLEPVVLRTCGCITFATRALSACSRCRR